MLFCIRLKYSSKINFACRKLIHFYRQFTCTWHDPPLNNWVRQPRQLLFQISGAICLLEVLFISFQSGSTGNQLICLFTFLFQKTTSCIEKKTKKRKKKFVKPIDLPKFLHIGILTTKDKSKNAVQICKSIGQCQREVFVSKI